MNTDSNEILWTVANNSLKKILADLFASPSVQSSTELSTKVRNAILFHNQIQKDYEELLNKVSDLKGKLSLQPDAWKDSLEEKLEAKLPEKFAECSNLRANGIDAHSICIEAIREGFSDIQVLKLLRGIFHIDLSEAKSILDGYNAAQYRVERQDSTNT